MPLTPTIHPGAAKVKLDEREETFSAGARDVVRRRWVGGFAPSQHPHLIRASSKP